MYSNDWIITLINLVTRDDIMQYYGNNVIMLLFVYIVFAI